MLTEALRIALRGILSNRLRSLLSLIGIVIGVASVVAVTAIAESGTADVRKQFEAFGQDAIFVFPGWDSQGPTLEFTPELIAKLAQVPDVRAVLRRNSLGGQFHAGRNTGSGEVIAVDSLYFQAMGATLDQGRVPDNLDEYARRAVVVLGGTLARQLFPEGAPVGKPVVVQLDKRAYQLEVIGVLNDKPRVFVDDWDHSAFVPYPWVTGRVSGVSRPQLLAVFATQRERVLNLADQLERFFLETTGQPGAAEVSSPRKWAEQNEQMTQTISLILSGIAAISLLVGGIGVMNIMLVSVAERKREIGIRKALGATPQHIRLQFLVESVLLTLLGGLLGLAVGYAVAALAVAAFHWAFVTSAGTSLLAFAVASGTGIFFGLYPAIRASRLDPVEALAAE